MRFGIREICDVVFKAKSRVKIGTKYFEKGQPVLYIDTAKTSTIEGAATTVYAQGGKGNTRLIAWEGEKTLTFTVEDALLSPIGFSVLSGAGLIKTPQAEEVHVHMTTNALMDVNGVIDLGDALGDNAICETAPVFVVATEGDGSVTGERIQVTIEADPVTAKRTILRAKTVPASQTSVFVDYYITKSGSTISEIQIDAANFAGYYYVEASTLFRRQEDGVDMPAEITFPNVKIQSNFTFSMASSGDPSTFTFTMDAFPGYTYFNQTKKVLCVIQVVEDADSITEEAKTVMGHNDNEDIETAKNDSTAVSLTVALKTTPVMGDVATAVEGAAVEATLTTQPAFEPDVAKIDTITGNTIAAVATTDQGVEKTATVSYTVDSTKLATYNTAHGTDYVASEVVLPAATSLTWKVVEVTTG